MEQERNEFSVGFVEKEVIWGGMVAGFIGGLLMAALEMAISATHGHGPFAPFYLIYDVVRGADPAAAARPIEIIIGFVIHLLIAAIVGGVFALAERALRYVGVIRSESRALDAFFEGIAFAIIVWGATRNVILLLWSNPALSELLAITPEHWFVAHIVYGGTLCLAPILTRAFYRAEGYSNEPKEKTLAA